MDIRNKTPFYVFISGPLHSSGRPSENVRKAVDIGMELHEALGVIPLVPHLFHFADMLRPRSTEFWMGLDLALVGMSDAVIRLPGYSEGGDRETDFALSAGKLVFENPGEFVSWWLQTNRPVINIKGYLHEWMNKHTNVSGEAGTEDLRPKMKQAQETLPNVPRPYRPDAPEEPESGDYEVMAYNLGIAHFVEGDKVLGAYDAIKNALAHRYQGKEAHKVEVRLSQLRDEIRLLDQLVDLVGPVKVDYPSIFGEAKEGEVRWVGRGPDGERVPRRRRDKELVVALREALRWARNEVGNVRGA